MIVHSSCNILEYNGKQGLHPFLKGKLKILFLGSILPSAGHICKLLGTAIG